MELLDGGGTVAASRRLAGKRRLERDVGGHRQRVAIEVPANHAAAAKSRIAFRPQLEVGLDRKRRPPVKEPRSKGFGRTVMRRSLQYSPNGGADLDFHIPVEDTAFFHG